MIASPSFSLLSGNPFHLTSQEFDSSKFGHVKNCLPVMMHDAVLIFNGYEKEDFLEHERKERKCVFFFSNNVFWDSKGKFNVNPFPNDKFWTLPN